MGSLCLDEALIPVILTESLIDKLMVARLARLHILMLIIYLFVCYLIVIDFRLVHLLSQRFNGKLETLKILFESIEISRDLCFIHTT